MKTNKFLIIITLVMIVKVNGQVRINNTTTNNSTNNSSSFIDASSNNSSNISTSMGKGLLYPRVDLTTFVFTGTSIGLLTSYPTRYDGLVVYNTGTGPTVTSTLPYSAGTPASYAPTNSVNVTPGFWYYSNPGTSGTGQTLKTGIWTKLGSDTVKNYTATPIKTATSIDGAQVWAVKGSFVASGTSALVSVTMPAGMTGYYKMTTYQGGKTFRSDISEFKMTTTVLNIDNVVTGNGLFSEVYPAGTYDYTLEYFQ